MTKPLRAHLGKVAFVLFAVFVLSSARAANSTAATASASSLATGTIVGRVINSRSQSTVENARVTVDGTALVTFTDADGNFQLTHVPAGSARLRVFFTGLAPQVVDVGVRANES